MIWHVPNDEKVRSWRDQAYLQYYTSNNFLGDVGGNLQTMYAKHYAMENVPSAGERLWPANS